MEPESLKHLCLRRILGGVWFGSHDMVPSQIIEEFASDPGGPSTVQELLLWPPIAHDWLNFFYKTEDSLERAERVSRMWDNHGFGASDVLIECATLRCTPFDASQVMALRRDGVGSTKTKLRISEFLACMNTDEQCAAFRRVYESERFDDTLAKFLYFHRHILKISRKWANSLVYYVKEGVDFATRWDSAMQTIRSQRHLNPAAWDLVGVDGSGRRACVMNSAIVYQMDRGVQRAVYGSRCILGLEDYEAIADSRMRAVRCEGTVPIPGRGAVRQGIAGTVEKGSLVLRAYELPDFQLTIDLNELASLMPDSHAAD